MLAYASMTMEPDMGPVVTLADAAQLRRAVDAGLRRHFRIVFGERAGIPGESRGPLRAAYSNASGSTRNACARAFRSSGNGSDWRAFRSK